MAKFAQKISEVLWLKDSIETYNILITIQEYRDIIPQPQSVDLSELNLENLLQEQESKEYMLRWQQKLFSSRELEYYSKIHNCISEKQKDYHRLINEGILNSNNLIYTYIHEDDTNFQTHYESFIVKHSSSVINRLCSKLEQTFMSSKENMLSGNGVIREKELLESDNVINMHVMINLGRERSTDECPQLRETVLVTLQWNPENRSLVIKPDCNDIKLNPYYIETGDRCGIKYAVRLVRDSTENQEKQRRLHKFISKLRNKIISRIELEMYFSVPLDNKTYYYVNVVLEYAREFTAALGNLYLEYKLQLPEYYRCTSGILDGRTIESECNKEKSWNFSHNMEFVLESDTDVSATSEHPRLLIEVISRDSWNRHRTEGYCFIDIIMHQAGRFKHETRCVRPLQSESERYFVGGAHLLDDITCIAFPDSCETQADALIKHGWKSTSTGCIKSTVDIIKQQNRKFSSEYYDELPVERDPSCEGLFRSVNAVLREYRKARARLRKCRDMLMAGEGTSFDPV